MTIPELPSTHPLPDLAQLQTGEALPALIMAHSHWRTGLGSPLWVLPLPPPGETQQGLALTEALGDISYLHFLQQGSQP